MKRSHDQQSCAEEPLAKSSKYSLNLIASPFSADSLVQIVSFLNDGKDVVSSSLVSSGWNSTIKDDLIWKNLCKNYLENPSYPFMKNIKGEWFKIESYEGL